MFSTILTLADLADIIIHNLTGTLLPPVVVVPFVTSLILAMSIPFTKRQWIIGLVASLIVIISIGASMPGPFIFPIYGFIFQIRRVKLAGAISAVTHIMYGVLLAPLVFVVSPAKIVYSWLLVYVGSFIPAFVILT